MGKPDQGAAAAVGSFLRFFQERHIQVDAPGNSRGGRFSAQRARTKRKQLAALGDPDDPRRAA